MLASLAMCALLATDDKTPALAGDSAATPVTIVVESPNLAGMISIPLVNSRKIEYSVSSFAGCTDNASRPPPLKELAKGKLVPKQNSASVTVPANLNLAVFLTYVNTSGGNSFSCGTALRFRGEPGKTYHVRYTSPQGLHRRHCDMEIYEFQDGNELPVASAHKALLVDNGLWKGSELDICAGE